MTSKNKKRIKGALREAAHDLQPTFLRQEEDPGQRLLTFFKLNSKKLSSAYINELRQLIRDHQEAALAYANQVMNESGV